MEIGTILSLSGKKEKYRTKVIDIDHCKHYLIIDFPIKETDGKTAFLQKGTLLRATFIDKNENIYQFKTQVLKRIKQRVPALVLNYPKKENIKRIQRRKFVRVPTAIDVAISSSNCSFPPFTTVSTDLSGGGISLVIPKEQKIKENEVCDLSLVLNMNSNKYHYLNVSGIIVRVHTQENDINTASIKFIQLTNQYQQLIIRFCFEKQREARRKELY